MDILARIMTRRGGRSCDDLRDAWNWAPLGARQGGAFEGDDRAGPTPGIACLGSGWHLVGGARAPPGPVEVDGVGMRGVLSLGPATAPTYNPSSYTSPNP